MPKFLDRIFIILYGALFVITPLIMYDKTSELFEFNKLLFIYSIAIFVAGMWAIKMIYYKKVIYIHTILDIPLFLFLLSQVISTFISIDVHTSVFGYYGRFNGGLLSTTAYIILYFGFVSNIDKSHFRKLLLLSVISAFAVFLWGLPSKFGHDLTCLLFSHQFSNNCWTEQFRPQDRMFSTLGQPNWLGAYFAIQFFISLYFAFEKKFTFHLKNLFYATIPLCLFLGILFTRSKSAIGATVVSFIIAVVFIYILFYTKKQISVLTHIKKQIVVGSFLFLLSLLIFKTGIESVDKYLNFGAKINQAPVVVSSAEPFSNVTDSFDIRKIVWTGAIQLWKRYPVFGTGVETFAFAYNFVRPIEHNYTSEWDFIYNKAHNEYLNYLATTGTVGLVTYIIYICTVLYLFIRKFLQEKSAEIALQTILLLSAWITILITNFFGFSTTTITIFFFLIPAFLISSQKQEYIKQSLKWMHSISITIVALFIVLAMVYFLNYFEADTEYSRGNSFLQNEDYASAYLSFSQAAKLRHEHVYEDKLSSTLADIALTSAYSGQATSDQLKKDIQNTLKLSEYYSDMAIHESPYSIYYYRTRAKNYFIFYEITSDRAFFNTAIKMLKASSNLAPTDPKNDYTAALFYITGVDISKSTDAEKNECLAFINHALSLKRDYRDALYLKGVYFEKTNQKDEAKKIFTDMLTKDPHDSEAKKELETL